MKHLFFTLLTTAFFTSNGVAQPNKTKLIEKITKKGNELVIPYEKYQLGNGLTVIIHEDHSDPIIHVDVTYHVGSAREQEGRSGFAHFFEHMMFQGSEHVGDEQHFKIVTEAGGTMNGTTNTDRTNYFETLPSNQLEVALWLEADRMGFLLDSVTQRKFEVQRSTVKNERGQNYDNKPYGIAGEKIGEALYPVGHPYSWQTIGYIEDLNRVDVNDLKKFFMRWYGPNNAALTIAGDVNPTEVLKLVEKYFGSIPRGPEVKMQEKIPVKLDKDRYVSYEDNVRFPMLSMVFPTVPGRHPDEAPLDVLADVIGGSKTSLFYQNFIKTQLAVQASVNSPCTELAGQFKIMVLPFPGKSLSEMETLARKIVDDFEKTGISDQDLERYKGSFESQLIGSLGSINGKASQLASNQTFTGNPNQIGAELERYKKVTKEDVMRVYRKYIKGQPSVILSVYPKGKPELIAKPNNFEVPKRNTSAPEAAEYKGLVYKKGTDNFDRSKKPVQFASPVVTVPDYWNESFANGVKVIGMNSDEIPMTTILLSIEAGHRFEDKSKAGIAQITADLMNESTLKHSAEEISAELEKLGSSIDISAGSQDISISITTLTKNVDATLKLAEEILLHPKFDSTEFDRSKNQLLQGIANQATQATVIANNVYNKLIYGENNIMSVPTVGSVLTVGAITLNDVKEFYKNNISPSVAQLVVVGNMPKETILPKLEFLKSWTGNKITHSTEESLPTLEKTKIYLVNKENAPQSEIRIGYMALPYDATGDYFKATVMNHSLGGSFNSRINLNLREDKGYTYGARSGFNGTKFAGPYTASAGVRGNVSDSSVIEFMKEVKKFADSGITEKELEYTKNAISQSEALKYETQGQKAGFLKRIVTYNLDKNYTQKQNELLKSMTKADVDALAKKYLPYDKMNILVVGDKAKIYDGILKLGYEVVELDNDGRVVENKKMEQLPIPSKELVPANPKEKAKK